MSFTEIRNSPLAHESAQRTLGFWILLVAATLLTWWLGEGCSGLPLAISLLALAAFKGSVVALEFMALRRAPWIWPALVFAWLTVVVVVVGIAYWKGIAS